MSKTNKIKQINKNGMTQAVIHSVKGQNLSEREVYAINNHELDGLLPVQVVRKGSAFKLIYDLNGLMPLSDFLLTPMNRETFAHLLQNVLDVLQGMQKMYFNQHALNMELDKVMINPAKQQLLFMYFPIQSFDSGGSLRNFLLDIVHNGSFVNDEDTTYVREYIRILNEGINFSVFELEEYIKGLRVEDGYRANSKSVCPKCNTPIANGAIYCSVCGVKISEIGKASSDIKTYDPASTQEVPKDDSESSESEKKDNDISDSEHGTQGLYRQWEADGGGTTILGYEAPSYPYLIYQKTSERIVIDKAEFYIGRSSKRCDYSLKGNIYIGRKHAVIFKQQGKYYVKDLHSLNGTFVNERRVTAEAELVSGAVLCLADENFIFYEEN